MSDKWRYAKGCTNCWIDAAFCEDCYRKYGIDVGNCAVRVIGDGYTGKATFVDDYTVATMNVVGDVTPPITEAAFIGESVNLRAENDLLKKQIRKLAVERLSVESQCIDEHHWKGNCPAEEGIATLAKVTHERDAARAMRDFTDQKLSEYIDKVEALETELAKVKADFTEFCSAAATATVSYVRVRADLDRAEVHLANATAERDEARKLHVEWTQEAGTLIRAVEAELTKVKAERDEARAKLDAVENWRCIGPDAPDDDCRVAEFEEMCVACAAHHLSDTNEKLTAARDAAVADWEAAVDRESNWIARLAAAEDREKALREAWETYRAKLVELHGQDEHSHAAAYGWVVNDVEAALAPGVAEAEDEECPAIPKVFALRQHCFCDEALKKCCSCGKAKTSQADKPGTDDQKVTP